MWLDASESSSTYWIVDIRPQLPRTATTVECYTCNRSSVSIFYGPVD